MQAAVSIVDTFSRSVSAGSWGTTSTGQTWLNENSSALVDGTYGTINVGVGASFRTHYIDLLADGIGRQGASSTLARVRWSSDVINPSTEFGLTLNQTATNTFYFCSVNDNFDEIILGVYINGVRWVLNQGYFLVHKDTDYWIRYEVNNSSGYTRVKIWQNGTAEPGSWTVSSLTWTGAYPPGVGNCGVYYRGAYASYTIKFSAFYYYTGEDTEAGLPLTDTFERTESFGFGVSSSNGLWQGNIALDPEIYVRTGLGLVTDPGDGYGEITIDETVSRYGLIGPRRSSAGEVYTEFSINSAAGNTFFYVGVRGRLNPTDGVPFPTGYGLYIASGATTVSIRKCTDGIWSGALATSGAFTALAANTVYSVRFQATGSGTSTILRGRIWVRGTAEPGTWNVTYNDTTSPITHSGSSWFELAQSVSTSRVLRLYHWDYLLPTATTTTTQTTTTTVTLQSATDTTLSMRANFTGDTSGTNNSISVRYRRVSSSDWFVTNVSVGSRVAGYWPFTISQLTPNTAYQVEVSYDDPEGVAGTNPILTTQTTTQLRIVPGEVTITGITENTVSFSGTYAGDSNGNASLAIDRRAVSATNYVFNDPMDEIDNLELSQHIPEVGTGWLKRSGVDMALVQSYTYPVVHSGAYSAFYTILDEPETANYEIVANVRFNHIHDTIGLVARYNPVLGGMYVAERRGNRWQIRYRPNGEEPLIEGEYAAPDSDLDIDHVYNMRFICRDEFKSLEIDGEEVVRITNNDLTAAGFAGFQITAHASSVIPYAVPKIGLFTLEERIAVGDGSWMNVLEVLASGGTFTINHGSLAPDTVYEFRATYKDASDGGPYGGNDVQILSAMTAGQAVTLSTLAVTPQYTKAVAEIAYDFDTNNNSTIDVQYRSSMDSIWTTLPPTAISVSRTPTKVFTATLVGLRPGTTYDIRVEAHDPNGIKFDGIAVLTTKFTTLNSKVSEPTLDKQYIWKVFNTEDEYVGTWRDATVPNFTWHTTTGLGECSVDLYRPFASVNNPAHDLNMMYRVDVYATAPNSDGVTDNLLEDASGADGRWVPAANAEIQETSGPDSGYALRIVAETEPAQETFSEYVTLYSNAPLVFSAIAKAQGGKLMVRLRSYNSLEDPIDTSNTFATTVGSEWQRLRFSYTPPPDAAFVRVVVYNDGEGDMILAQPVLSQTEKLIYRGYIQEYTAEVNEQGESVSVELYSISTMLAKDYVEWIQFMSPPPAEDAADGKPNNPSADPAVMLMNLIDIASLQNPRFNLSYTATSIKMTGITNDFTFEDMTFQNAFEAILDLSPPGWSIIIDPHGVVSFFGPEHAHTHRMRLGVEILAMKKNPHVRDVINYVIVYGKQVEGQANPEDNVKIKYIAFDQESIDKHGRRVHIERNSGIETDRAAEIVAEGRLAEFSKTTESLEIEVLDQNSFILSPNQAMRGYPIERLCPGDYVYVTDPVALPEESYWDAFVWDQDSWDGDLYRETTITPLPIKSIKYNGDSVQLDLSERPPSVTKAFGRMWRYLQKQEREDRLGILDG